MQLPPDPDPERFRGNAAAVEQGGFLPADLARAEECNLEHPAGEGVGDGVDTWQDLLRAADAELYRVKAEKKKAGVQIR